LKALIYFLVAYKYILLAAVALFHLNFGSIRLLAFIPQHLELSLHGVEPQEVAANRVEEVEQEAGSRKQLCPPGHWQPSQPRG
jgi:hypothetical protein